MGPPGRRAAKASDSEQFRSAPTTCLGGLRVGKTGHGTGRRADGASGRKSPMLQKQRREFVILRGAAALLIAADARLAANLSAAYATT
jgi:hypothetical protein